MSTVSIRKALEIALNAIAPALATAWENAEFVPVTGTPYQAVNLMFATPENPSFGGNFVRERGIFQVTLQYPIQTGVNAAMARAELIKSVFYRGATFVNSGVYVTIDKTPEIAPGSVDGDRWTLPVKIRFYANI